MIVRSALILSLFYTVAAQPATMLAQAAATAP